MPSELHRSVLSCVLRAFVVPASANMSNYLPGRDASWELSWATSEEDRSAQNVAQRADRELFRDRFRGVHLYILGAYS